MSMTHEDKTACALGDIQHAGAQEQAERSDSRTRVADVKVVSTRSDAVVEALRRGRAAIVPIQAKMYANLCADPRGVWEGGRPYVAYNAERGGSDEGSRRAKGRRARLHSHTALVCAASWRRFRRRLRRAIRDLRGSRTWRGSRSGLRRACACGKNIVQKCSTEEIDAAVLGDSLTDPRRAPYSRS